MPQRIIDRGGGKLVDLAAQKVAELLAVHLVARDTHQREFLGKQIVLRQVVERRDELALGEISGSAEDHHRARIARPSSLLVITMID